MGAASTTGVFVLGHDSADRARAHFSVLLAESSDEVMGAIFTCGAFHPMKRSACNVTAPSTMARLGSMDAAGIPALVEAIRHLHGLEATWLESVPVHEQHEGQTVWEGEVQVFAVEHPKATRIYAWSHETEGGKRRFHAVLGVKPVDGAVMAVRVSVLSTDGTSGSPQDH